MSRRLAALSAALLLLAPGPTALGAAPVAAPVAAPPAGPPAPPPEPPEEPLPELPEPSPRLDDPFIAELEVHRADAIARARTVEATLPLLRAFNLRERLSSLAPLARLYGQFVEWGAVTPEVRALARHLLLQIQRSRGRVPAAQEQFQKLGFVTRGWLAGPFDNEAKGGCDTAWAPEKNLDLKERFPGKVRPIGWRRLPEVSRDGFVDLGAMLSPDDETVAYVLGVVEVPAADTKAVLHLGASGASRLFVNGVKVYSDDAYRPPRFDAAQVGVTLKKGANRILLKVCHDRGPHGFYLRVAGPNGDALPGATITAPDPLPAAPKGPVPFEAMASPATAFRKRAEAAKDDARARLEYAEMLVHRPLFDSKDRRDAAEAARAAQLAPKDPVAQLLAAYTADDSNERRRYFEAALAAQPLHPAASVGLARWLMGHDLTRRAMDLLDPALKKHPTHYPLALQQTRALEDLGLVRQSGELVQRTFRAWPDRPEVVREAARLARRQERMKDSVALLRVAIALRFDDLESRRMLIAALADLGDVEGALKEQREVDAIDPWDVRSWLRLAEFAAANDRGEEARTAFARATEIAPEEAEVFERQGQALARLGDTAGAVKALSRSLELKPQNQSAKEALKALRREGRGFGEEFAYDALKLMAETPPTPGEDAVVLADLTAVKVHPSGLSSRFEQTVLRVQTARGVEAERNLWVTVSPDRQDLKILRARVIRPDGSIIESHTESERSLSDSASKLYYDARAHVIGFPNLAPGDVIELAYRLDDTANDNLLSDYFGDVQNVQAELPKARFDYILSAPPGRTLFSNRPALTLKRQEEPRPDGTRLYRWSARDVPKVVPEPGMPGRSEVAALLHVSTYKDWDAVGRYYWGLIRDQLNPTDEIRATAKEILAEVPKGDELAAIRAVYGFVVTKTRYVGLEFGIHGFKPYKVDKVLARRFGDCKDKASLMHALLEVAGIESRLVLLRMRRLGGIDPAPASLAIFDHAILYVPKHDLWLDGTAELHGSREVPVEDLGATVLVIEPQGGSKLAVTPEGKASANLTRSSYEVTLGVDGNATLKGTATISGLAAPDYRRSFQQVDGRKERYEQGWARTFPGIKVRELTLSDLGALEKDVEMGFAMDAPAYAQREGGALTFTPFGQGASYVESFAPLSSRTWDLVLSYPWSNRFKYRVTLPAGQTATDLPKDVDAQGAFGGVKLAYRLEGQVLTAEGEIRMDVPRIKAAEYPAFRTFLGQIDQALGRRIRVVPAK